MKYVVSVAVVAVFLSGLGAIHAEAFGGGFGKGGAGNSAGIRGQGMGSGGGMSELVPAELREEYRREHREQMQSLSAEERQALKKERRENMQALRDERHAQMEAFVGLSREELREAHANGETMGETLTRQGLTEADAVKFLADKAESQVERIVERHDLSTEQEQTLRERLGQFVERMLAKWFAK